MDGSVSCLPCNWTSGDATISALTGLRVKRPYYPPLFGNAYSKGRGYGGEDSRRFHSALALPSNKLPIVEVPDSHRCNAVGIRGALCYLFLTCPALQVSVSFILRSPCRRE